MPWPVRKHWDNVVIIKSEALLNFVANPPNQWVHLSEFQIAYRIENYNGFLRP